jgi:hypothetical protein
MLLEYPGGATGSYAIPGTVTNIGDSAFEYCYGLTNVNIPGSVTSIGESAFAICSRLTNVCFWGNAPAVGSSVFFSDVNATVYYLADTTGWTSQFAGRPSLPMPAFNYMVSAGAISITGY